MTASFLRIRDNVPQWPYSVAQFRADEPQLSISNDPHVGELASYASLNPPILIYKVTPTNPLDVTNFSEPRTQRASESEPVQNTEGNWEQTWTVRDATEAEIAEWDIINNPDPEPDWVAFKLLSLGSPQFKEIITQALLSDPVNALGLQLELNELIHGGDPRPFFAAITSVFNAVQPDPSVIRSFAAAARMMNLPSEFVDMLLSLVPTIDAGTGTGNTGT
jgi:hypothetical protein